MAEHLKYDWKVIGLTRVGGTLISFFQVCLCHLLNNTSFSVLRCLQSKMETERLISLVGKNPSREAVPRPLLRSVIILY